jgi:hypothetical protein
VKGSRRGYLNEEEIHERDVVGREDELLKVSVVVIFRAGWGIQRERRVRADGVTQVLKGARQSSRNTPHSIALAPSLPPRYASTLLFDWLQLTSVAVAA